MKLKQCILLMLTALLLTALLCGCAARTAVTDRDAAAAQLDTYLHDFVYEQEDDYVCSFIDAQQADGKTVYRFEAFWEEDGEQYSLGVFSVSSDGTVTPDE